MSIRDNLLTDNTVQHKIMLCAGSRNYPAYEAIDVRKYKKIHANVYATNTSPTLYFYGTTQMITTDDITVTDSSATVNHQDSHDVKTIKATSAQISTGISLDIDLSDYDYLVMVKNTNGGAQAFGVDYTLS